jgi:pimeloyl-ACP methyl ester carboxylesterase
MSPERFLTRGGKKLALYARGEGRPVLFQHGLCGDAEQAFEAFPELPGWRLHTLECRGHGASEAGGDYSLAAFAEDAGAVLDGLGPSVLGGISMGAAIALMVAVLRPEKTRALILARPAWGIASAPPNLRPNAELGALLAELPQKAAKAAFAAGATAKRLAREAPDNLASLLAIAERAPIRDTAKLLAAISADGMGLAEADLARIGAPTLVLGTGDDLIHPLALARDLTARIPGARFAELPPKGRGKAAHLAAMREKISDFLSEQKDATPPARLARSAPAR